MFIATGKDTQNWTQIKFVPIYLILAENRILRAINPTTPISTKTMTIGSQKQKFVVPVRNCAIPHLIRDDQVKYSPSFFLIVTILI